MSGIVVPSIFTAIDKFSAPVRKMTGSLDQFEAKANRLERNFRGISQGAKKVAQTSATVGLAILAPLGLAANSAVEFEAKMSNISTLVDTNTESMSAMSDEVLKLSTRLPASLDDLTTSLYDIRSAGIPANQAMQTLEQSTVLATAGLGTVSEATDIMTSAMNSFASEGKSSTEIANILFKTVKFGKTNIAALSQAFGANASIIQSAGIGLADFQAATAALTTTGLPAAQAQNQIRASIVKLLKPTSEMEKIFASLGVTTGEELVAKYGTLGETYKAIEGQSKKLGLGLAGVLGSSEALSAVTSINTATNKAYLTTLEDMKSGSDAVTEAFDKQMLTGKAQLQIAKNNLEAISITIGNQLIPVLTELMKRIAPVISSFLTWTKENQGTFKTIVVGTAVIGALLLALAAVSTVVSGVTGIIAAWGLITKLATVAQIAWAAALNLGIWPITLIAAGIAALIALVTVIIRKWDEWGAALTLVLGPLGFIISTIQSFRRNWDMIVSSFKTGGIIAGFKAIGATLIDALLMPLQQVFELLSNVPVIGEFAASAASNIAGLRGGLGVETAPLVNNDVARSESLQRTVTESRQNVAIDINDRTGNAQVDPGSGLIPVNITSTFAP